jgi:predicted enzyme related to lactoylglutathione lyase
MPDPFEALRSAYVPVDPDPAFAARLRARVERALSLPQGVIVSQTTLEAEPAPTARTPGLIPYLTVADTRRALGWYVEAFGARPTGDPIVMPDGRVGHAELELAGAVLYVADESPESHVAAPRPGADATVSLVIEVADVDLAIARAAAAGAEVERPAVDNPYGRNAVVRDPFGHRWMLSAPAPAEVGAVPTMRTGDIGYASLWVPDVAKAAAFFGAVLGWTYRPGSSEQGRQVEGTTPHHGLWGDQPRSTMMLCYAVDDVDATLARVRAAGGTTEEPVDAPYGRVADCVDDDGTAFAVFSPPAGDPTPLGPPNGARHGDLAYVTVEVRDSARTRAFYGAVLGWRFTPGRVADGWGVEDVRPMTGLHGGHEQATVVPMYRVDDIEAAVARVRAAGGRATDPQRQPYGISAECADDQGTRFYLGQL